MNNIYFKYLSILFMHKKKETKIGNGAIVAHCIGICMIYCPFSVPGAEKKIASRRLCVKRASSL